MFFGTLACGQAPTPEKTRIFGNRKPALKKRPQKIRESFPLGGKLQQTPSNRQSRKASNETEIPKGRASTTGGVGAFGWEGARRKS